MSKNFTTSRNCCFTLNNPTQGELDHLNAFTTKLPDGVKRITFQLEKGENGTPHLQGYCEFTKVLSKTAMKTLLGTDRLHLEKRVGTVDQAVRYCQKKETQLSAPVTVGDFTDAKTVKVASKMTYDLVYLLFKQGKRLYDIQEMAPGWYFKNKKVIFDMYNSVKQATKKFAPKIVIVISGKTGVGKTRFFYDNYNSSDSFILTKPSANNNLWLDGYMDQKYVCIDEFYGWIPLNTMLNMLDGYGMQLENKGGFCWWTPEIIYITSNTSPKNWYRWDDMKDGDTLKAALLRRITHVIEVASPDIPYEILKPKLIEYLKLDRCYKRITYTISDQLAQTETVNNAETDGTEESDTTLRISFQA